MKPYSQICIIDDDAISVFGFKRALTSIGFTPELSIFENGLDALENFEELLEEDTSLPSILFIDLNMPVMDGWDFVEELTKLKTSDMSMPEIYIMTSSVDTNDIETAKTYGLETHYLIKPVSAKILESIFVCSAEETK
ncbi:MAG TPA: response regulator [Pricia antarctica]|uniref:Response regulator n=2 Tax=root TaxID=1 RepID=A0A831VT59_9FLAO|nr:response regulator [Pricia antarctica]